MKEIIAIVRMNKIQKTKDALVEIGCPSMTVNKVLGRGKQKGLRLLRQEIDPEDVRWETKMKYIPKRMISIIEEDNMVDRVVRTIMEVNRTGEIGDGRIFVCPIDDAIRIRTGERGEEAI